MGLQLSEWLRVRACVCVCGGILCVYGSVCMNAWEATAPSPSLGGRGQNWTVAGPVRALLSFPSPLRQRKHGGAVLRRGLRIIADEQLLPSAWPRGSQLSVITALKTNSSQWRQLIKWQKMCIKGSSEKGKYKPNFLCSANSNTPILNEWYIGVSRFIFPSSFLMYFLLKPYLPS